MKWNWGTKIALLYSSFVIFIGVMVYKSFGQQYDLVTEDYYEAEIAFQGTIDKKSRTEELEKSLQATVENSSLNILLPTAKRSDSGNIYCFRPSDKSKDLHFSFKNKKQIALPLQKFSKGKYIIKVDWKVGVEKYYAEQTVIIP